MNRAPVPLTPVSRREMQLMGLAFAVVFLALFAFNLITLRPPLTPAALLAYTLLSLALAAVYVLVMSRSEQLIARYRLPGVVLMLFLGAGLLFAISLVLRGRAELYFYLVTFDGYGGFIYFLAFKRRWAVSFVIGMMAVAGLSYAALWGWEAAGAALMGDLPWYGFAAALAEFTIRQWQQRERVERMAAELAEAHRQLQDYAAQAEALAVAQERARLAHEIHDTVGHTLTALDVQLELLARLPPGQTGQRQQAARHARALVKTGLADVRRAVKALRPAALETFSLPEAIAALVDDFERTTHVRTAWQVEGKVAPLPPRLAVPLYRTAQETLTNVQRHAPDVGQVTLQLHYGPEAVRLSVENDGVPAPLWPKTSEVSGDFGGLAQAGQGGYGLRGLRERAEALGGAFSAGPDGAGSFRVEIRLPMPQI